VIDSSDPFAPFVIGSWQPADANLTALAVEAGLAAVADGAAVRLVELGDLTAPIEVGAIAVSAGLAVRPILNDGRLWIVNGRGFDVFDVSSPATPLQLGAYRTGGWSADLAIDGTIGYLADRTELHVLDLASPASVTPLAIIDLGESLYAVDVSGGLVGLSGERSYLITVDVTDPAAPVVLARLSGGPAFDVVLDGVTATIAAGSFGVLVADIGDPSFPSFLAYYDASGAARAVAIDGPVVHLAATEAQHWLFTCDACGASCALGVMIQAATTTICSGTPLDLEAVPTVVVGCPSGLLFYRWFEEGWPIAGATLPLYQVPPSHAVGSPTFMVEVTCADDPTCARRASIGIDVIPDSWPTHAANSLMAVRRPSDRLLSWTLASGSGESNVHRTSNETELPGLAADLSAVIGVAPSTVFADAAEPLVGEVLFYRVFGRSVCSGSSVDPP